MSDIQVDSKAFRIVDYGARALFIPDAGCASGCHPVGHTGPTGHGVAHAHTHCWHWRHRGHTECPKLLLLQVCYEQSLFLNEIIILLETENNFCIEI